MSTTKEININKENKVDGWENLFTGMGRINQDKKTATTFIAGKFMQEQELIDLYVANGLARKIIDILPNSMLREGFKIDKDEGELIGSRLEVLNAFKEIELLLKWNRLFGGAICVMGINDGSIDLSNPVNYQNIQELIFLRTYDRWRISWSSADLYNNPTHAKYGQIQYYTINPMNGLPSFRVHESRCIVMRGCDIPESARVMNQGWGTSVMQDTIDTLRSLGSCLSGLDSIIDDFITSVLSVKNLADMMYSGEDSKVKNRLELLDLSKHIINTVLLDAENEQYTKQSSSVAGLDALIQIPMTMLSAITGIPQRILYGKQAGCLNNAG